MSRVRRLFIPGVWRGALDRLAAARRGALLSVLTIAVEKQLPLVPVLEAFAQDTRGTWRHNTSRLAAALSAGVSLPDALEAIPGLVPPSAVLAARVGEESGTLGPALRVASEAFAARQDAARSRAQGILVYLISMSFAMFIIVGFVMYWIIPKLKKIFEDFGTELPSMTLALIHISNWIVNYFYLIIVVPLAIFLVVYVMRTQNPADSAGLSLLSRFLPRLRTPEVLRCLAVVVQARRPILSGLTSLTTHHPDRVLCRRLQKVEFDVQSGDDVWNSLVRVELLRPADTAVLISAERVGNLAWALRATADNIDRRFDYRFQLFLEFFRPAALVLFGAVIGAIVIALFMPLLKLLGDLA